MRLRLFTAATMLATIQLFGQTFDRVLVPIHLRGQTIEGAHGSRWTSELRIFNSGSTDAFIENFGPVCTVPCPTPIPPAKVFDGDNLNLTITNPGPGVLLLVEQPYAGQLVFQSRVRDLSREAAHWGAWLPVVRESEATTDTLHLLSIPIEPGFRQTLRVYSFDSMPGQEALIRVFLTDPKGESADELVSEFVLALDPGSSTQPAYAEAAELVEPDEGREVRIAIAPEGQSTALWGMVSLTNNTTQEVTMIVPNSSDPAAAP